ncbi:MAG: hypothetical protein F4138_02160 [Acidimicrobiia bacterium]|nr:hypothetical protein [Acidimicrobiia bacterium]
MICHPSVWAVLYGWLGRSVLAMKTRTRKAVATVVAISIVLALLFSLLVVFSSTASGHAELRRSAPRPTQEVGGVVDRVEMQFRQRIRPHQANQVVLEHPDGTRVQTQVELNGYLVRGRFDALVTPGEYKVIWGLVDDEDGDWSTQEFPFRYEPLAAAPEWLPESAAFDGDGGDGGGAESETIVLVVVIALAVVLGGWLLWPRRRPRR